MDANQRHAPGKKGFRAVDFCGEHNFLTTTLIDHPRRKHRPLYEVRYDFKNVFGSVPLKLLWDALQRAGVPEDYVAMCQGRYDHTTRGRQRHRRIDGASAATGRDIPREPS